MQTRQPVAESTSDDWMADMEKKKSLTLGDIASELGLSKSTVSRAISGRGNLGEATRKRVNEYIKLHGYQPNAAAQRLAEGRTGNIGVVLPADAFSHLNTFFQLTLLGICQEAARHNYDVLVTSVFGDDITYLKRLVSRHSADGVILMRSLISDPSLDFLSETDMRFVTIGSSEHKDVLQVDIQHEKACRELTLKMLSETDRPIGLLLGDENYVVNRNRKKGYLSALASTGRKSEDNRVISDIYVGEELIFALRELVQSGAETIICGDDDICVFTQKLIDAGKIGNTHVRLASFYDNATLESRGISAVSVDDMSLGAAAVTVLLAHIENQETAREKVAPGYTINFRK